MENRRPPHSFGGQASVNTPVISGALEFTTNLSPQVGFVSIRTARNDDEARYNTQVAALMFTGEHAAADMRAAAAVLMAEADAADAAHTDTPKEA